MNDFLGAGPFTLFDIIVLLLVSFSGLMALARGFIREIASILAFVAALIAGFYAWKFLGPIARGYLPDGFSPLISDVTVVAIAFLVIYILAAWLGNRFSRLIHATADIGFVDRLFGLAFGIFRGLAVVVLVLLATRPFIEDAQIDWITTSFSYPHFTEAVIWVQTNFIGFTEGVREALTDGSTESQ